MAQAASAKQSTDAGLHGDGIAIAELCTASLGALYDVHHAYTAPILQHVYLRQLPVLGRLRHQVHALALVGALLLGCASCRQ